MRRFFLPAVLLTSGLVACSDSSPNVIFETNAGIIEVEVYPKKAPLSAGDFLYHVDEGLYNNQGFYRTVTWETDPLDMGMSIIQGGRLALVPVTPFIGHEATGTTGLSNVRGSLAIARDAVGSGSAAYFFINVSDNKFLDEGGTRNEDGAGYAVFGKVISGLDVAAKIQKGKVLPKTNITGTENQFLEQPVIITKAYRK